MLGLGLSAKWPGKRRTQNNIWNIGRKHGCEVHVLGFRARVRARVGIRARVRVGVGVGVRVRVRGWGLGLGLSLVRAHFTSHVAATLTQ